MIGTPLALSMGIAAFRTASDRGFAVAALGISVFEALALVAVLLLSAFSGE